MAFDVSLVGVVVVVLAGDDLPGDLTGTGVDDDSFDGDFFPKLPGPTPFFFFVRVVPSFRFQAMASWRINVVAAAVVVVVVVSGGDVGLVVF